jgi:hypothetical protein
LGRQCQAEPKPIKIPTDFDVSQYVFNHCPLPDFDSIIEILGNPNPSFWVAKGKRGLTKKQQDALANLKHIAQLLKNPVLTQEEEDALADCGDQVALGELDSQEALSRVLMTRLIPKHRN